MAETSRKPAPKPMGNALGRRAQDQLGERLRAMYNELGQLPIPKRILDVLEELKQLSQENGRDDGA